MPRNRRWLCNQLDVCHFHVGGSDIDRVTSFIHLGHTINKDLNDRDDIWHRRHVFIGQVNNVICYFPRPATDVRYTVQILL